MDWSRGCLGGCAEGKGGVRLGRQKVCLNFLGVSRFASYAVSIGFFFRLPLANRSAVVSYHFCVVFAAKSPRALPFSLIVKRNHYH